MIRSTRRFSSSPTGCRSFLRCSSSSLKASSSSPGRRISSDRRPCLRAFRRTASFPSGVLGPVLFRAFRLLDWAFFSLVIISTFRNVRVDSVEGIVERNACKSSTDFRCYGLGRLNVRLGLFLRRLVSKCQGTRGVAPLFAVDGRLTRIASYRIACDERSNL